MCTAEKKGIYRYFERQASCNLGLERQTFSCFTNPDINFSIPWLVYTASNTL